MGRFLFLFSFPKKLVRKNKSLVIFLKVVLSALIIDLNYGRVKIVSI